MDNTNLGIEQAIYELIGCSDILLLTFLRSSSCDFLTFSCCLQGIMPWQIGQVPVQNDQAALCLVEKGYSVVFGWRWREVGSGLALAPCLQFKNRNVLPLAQCFICSCKQPK